MSQLKKGAILSYVTIFLTNAVGLVLTPFIIRSLGDSEYGLYTLIGAFVGYISVMDLGLNNTIVRFVAKYRAEKDKQGEENFLATTMLIYAAISVMVVIIGTVMYINLDNVFGNSLTPDQMDKAKVMFTILIFNLAITLPGGAFTAICNGYERFVFPRGVNIFRYIIRSALVVALLLYGGDAIGLVLLDTTMNILVIALKVWYVLRKLKVRFKLHHFELPLVKEIFSYSVWIFVMAIVMEFQWKSGQVILGIKENTVTVAVYAVGILLGSYYGAFANAINSLFLPKAMKMVVSNADGAQLTDDMVKIGRVTLIILLLILGGFFIFGREFVYLWVGETYSDAWQIALLIMIVSTNILVQSFANSVLKARKLFKFKGLTYILMIIIGVITGYFLIDKLGGFGMIIGISAGWFVSQMIMNFYFNKKLNLDIKRFYIELFKNLLLAFLIVSTIAYLANSLFTEYSWISIFFKITTYIILYCMAIYFLGMNKYEKELVKNIVKFK